VNNNATTEVADDAAGPALTSEIDAVLIIHNQKACYNTFEDTTRT
jgi:hypothetical protein